jgi:tRNA(Ser,Leu) C12 N-acetylase TAN1
MDTDLVSRLVLEESKGFLSELWHRIKMFFTKIFEAIAGIFVGFDDKKESAAESAKKALDEASEEDLSLMSFSDEKAIKILFSEKETKTYKKSEIDILKVMERYNTVTSVVSNIIKKSEEYNKTRFERVNKYIDKLIEYSGKDDKLDVEAEKKKDDYFSDKKAHSIFSNSLEDGVKSSFGYNDDVVISYKIIFTDPSKGILTEKVNIDDKIKLEGEANDKILLFPSKIVKNNKNKFIEFIDKIKQQNVSKNVLTLEKLWQEESKKLEEKIKNLDEKKDKKPELHTEATKVLNAVQTVYKNELQTITKLASTMDKITIGVMSITSDVVNSKSGSGDGEKPSSA